MYFQFWVWNAMLVRIRTVIKTNALKPQNNVKNIKISVRHGCDGEVSTYDINLHIIFS